MRPRPLRPRASGRPRKLPDLPPRFAQQADVGDDHAAVDGLAHVVDGQRRDARRRSAPPSRPRCARRSLQVAVISTALRARVDGEVDLDRGQRQRMAERDQIGGALGRHDPGEPRHREHVALRHLAGARSGPGSPAASGRVPRRWRLRSVSALAETSTMRGLALGVEMGEARHQAVRVFSSGPRARSRRVAAATSASRIRDSPTRKQRRPDAARRARSAGSASPLSATSEPVRAARAAPGAPAVRKIDRQGLEIAVVDADQARRKPQRAVELGLVMDLDQHIHAPARRRRHASSAAIASVSAAMISSTQSAPMRAGFDDLIGIEHEILAQHRQIDGGAGGVRDTRRCPGNRARRSAPRGRWRRPSR